MRVRVIVASILAAFVIAAGAHPARAVVTLDGATVDGAVLPWVQALANNDPTPPGLTLTGAELTPTGDAWQAGASVTVNNQGGTYEVLSAFSGVTRVDIIQATER